MTKSKHKPKTPPLNAIGLPVGSGSLQARGNYWWMIYRDAEGKRVQENSWVSERADAVRVLAVRSRAVLQARIDVLEKVING